MEVVPLHDRILVHRDPADSTTKGGIVLPDGAKDKPQRGTVRSIGSGRLAESGQRIPLSVMAGDRVLFTAYAGDEFRIGEERLLLMREQDVLAVIRDEEGSAA